MMTYDDLYKQKRSLLYAMARRYARACELDRAVSIDDLVQTGFIGLMKAAETYDDTAGKSWASWAVWHIKHEYGNLLGIREGRFMRAHTGADSLDRPLSVDDAEGISLGDLLPDDSLPESDVALLQDEVVRTVREAVSAIPDALQRQALVMTRLEDKTIKQAAEALSVDPQAINNMNRRSFRRLRHDKTLRRLAYLDGLTRFHAHKGVAAFNSDWTSTVEAAVLWRDEMRTRLRPAEEDSKES